MKVPWPWSGHLNDLKKNFKWIYWCRRKFEQGKFSVEEKLHFNDWKFSKKKFNDCHQISFDFDGWSNISKFQSSLERGKKASTTEIIFFIVKLLFVEDVIRIQKSRFDFFNFIFKWVKNFQFRFSQFQIYFTLCQ